MSRTICLCKTRFQPAGIMPNSKTNASPNNQQTDGWIEWRITTFSRISGSLRRGSYNTRLLAAVSELLPEGMSLETFDSMRSHSRSPTSPSRLDPTPTAKNYSDMSGRATHISSDTLFAMTPTSSFATFHDSRVSRAPPGGLQPRHSSPGVSSLID